MEHEDTISLQELFGVLRKRLFLIISLAIIAVAASAAVSYFYLTPVYQTSATLIIKNSDNQTQEKYNLTEMQTDLKLINTYKGMITGEPVLEEVIKELDLDMSPGQLAGKISVENQNETMIMKINVKDPDPYLAADIANKTAEVFIKEAEDIMGVENIEIYPEAKVSPNQGPVSPNPQLNIAIALIVGLMVGVGLAFLLEYLDNTIKTEQDIEKTLELPVIGVVMDINEFMKASEAKKAMQQEKQTGGETVGS